MGVFYHACYTVLVFSGFLCVCLFVEEVESHCRCVHTSHVDATAVVVHIDDRIISSALQPVSLFRDSHIVAAC